MRNTKMTNLERVVAAERQQREWIKDCNAGTSYDGPDGDAIRTADIEFLNRVVRRRVELERAAGITGTTAVYMVPGSHNIESLVDPAKMEVGSYPANKRIIFPGTQNNC